MTTGSFNYKSSSKVSFGLNNHFGITTSRSQKIKGPNTIITAEIDQSDYVPKRFGLKYDPPMIILEYLVPSSGGLYHHKMKIQNLKSTSRNEEIIENLREKHGAYLPLSKISDQQIIHKLKKRLAKGDIEEIRSIASKNSMSTAFTVPNNENTSKLSPSSYNSADQENDWRDGPNVAHLKSQSYSSLFKPLSPVAKSTTSTPVVSLTNKLWGKDDRNKATSTTTLSNNSKQPPLSSTQGFWDDDESDRDVDYSKLDLNKLSTEELSKHKKKMDAIFVKNQKKPGDPGFVYDTREEFHPQESNDWDDEL